MNQKSTFKAWFENHQGLVYKVARSYASTPEDLDDLFQEIMLQLWRSIPSFKGDSRESTWIYRVGLNTALGWSRKERNRSHTENKAPAFSVPTPASSLEHREKLEQVYEIIHSLPHADSSVLLLHLEGLSYQEISDVLGISASHVGVKLHRVRKRINEQYGGATHDHG
jgi:RNA polymerase sigma-70 factor, ECF subfamily